MNKSKWHREHAEQLKEYNREYRNTNKETIRTTQKSWQIKNRNHHLAYRRFIRVLKRLLIKQQTPMWADLKKIKQFYKECPHSMTVDHIVPLKGKNVCGLHVEYNLQYLTLSENSRKNNKTDWEWTKFSNYEFYKERLIEALQPA